MGQKQGSDLRLEYADASRMARALSHRIEDMITTLLVERAYASNNETDPVQKANLDNMVAQLFDKLDVLVPLANMTFVLHPAAKHEARHSYLLYNAGYDADNLLRL